MVQVPLVLDTPMSQLRALNLNIILQVAVVRLACIKVLNFK